MEASGILSYIRLETRDNPGLQDPVAAHFSDAQQAMMMPGCCA
jgi:hypothetical protein